MDRSLSSIPRFMLLVAALTCVAPQPSVAIQFRPPGDAAPASSLGGGVRGKLQFSTSGNGAPQTSLGGGVRGKVQFAAPSGANPSSSLGGGVRGRVQFTLPAQSSPSQSAGGGVRGSQLGFEEATTNTLLSLSTDPDPVTPQALLPDTGVIGRTVSAHPTFFVYLPPSPAREVFFSIQDEQGNPHYHTTLPITGEGGIVAITLPSDAPALAVNQNYAWFLAAIEPNDILRPDSVGTIGWVKRVPLDSVADLAPTASNLDRATAYAAAGIWYDTLSLLANPNPTIDGVTLVSEWNDLLTQVGLGYLVDESITAL